MINIMIKNLLKIFLFEKKILYIYFIYISLIFFASLIFAFAFSGKFYVADINNNLIIKNITFGFGNVIDNLYNHNSYFETIDGTKYFLTKMPAIPFFYWAILKISKNYFFFVCFKNIIIFSLYFFLSYYFSKDFKVSKIFYLLLLIPVIVPYNFNVSLNYVYEDNLISIFLPLLFLSLISKNNNRVFIISTIFFILFFVKTTMFFIVTIIPVAIFFIEKKFNYFLRSLPLIFSFIAILIWGIFGLTQTGRFPFASSTLTTNSQGLSVVLNKEFANYYPNKSVDIIPMDKIEFKSEWEAFDYYEKQNKTYFRENYDLYFRDILLKIKFIFLGIHRDGDTTHETVKDYPQIRYSSIISKFLLNLAIIISAFRLFKNIKKPYNCKIEIYFLLIIVLNLAPHVVAWATSKHLVGIFNTSLVYLLILFTKRNNFKTS